MATRWLHRTSLSKRHTSLLARWPSRARPRSIASRRTADRRSRSRKMLRTTPTLHRHPRAVEPPQVLGIDLVARVELRRWHSGTAGTMRTSRRYPPPQARIPRRSCSRRAARGASSALADLKEPGPITVIGSHWGRGDGGGGFGLGGGCALASVAGTTSIIRSCTVNVISSSSAPAACKRPCCPAYRSVGSIAARATTG